MIKNYWQSNIPKTHQLIAIANNRILKIMKRVSDIREEIALLEKGEVPETMEGIPFGYVAKIINEAPKNEIAIHYGKESKTKLKFQNKEDKNACFNLIRSQLKGFNYKNKLPYMWEYAKGKIIAIFILTAIFLYSYCVAVEIEKGVKFELEGSKPGIGAIVLFFASFGSFNVFAGYLTLLTLLLLLLYNRLKQRSVLEYLIRN